MKPWGWVLSLIHSHSVSLPLSLIYILTHIVMPGRSRAMHTLLQPTLELANEKALYRLSIQSQGRICPGSIVLMLCL